MLGSLRLHLAMHAGCVDRLNSNRGGSVPHRSTFTAVYDRCKLLQAYSCELCTSVMHRGMHTERACLMRMPCGATRIAERLLLFIMPEEPEGDIL